METLVAPNGAAPFTAGKGGQATGEPAAPEEASGLPV